MGRQHNANTDEPWMLVYLFGGYYECVVRELDFLDLKTEMSANAAHR
jgi:hypothetical protein